MIIISCWRRGTRDCEPSWSADYGCPSSIIGVYNISTIAASTGPR